MIYGPGSGQRIEQSLVDLGANLGQAPLRAIPQKYSYDAGTKKKFGVKHRQPLCANQTPHPRAGPSAVGDQ